MNTEKYTRGSEWRKWDLHFHTSTSHDYQNKSITNQQVIDKLAENNISAVAITDHHTIDVSKLHENSKISKRADEKSFFTEERYKNYKD